MLSAMRCGQAFRSERCGVSQHVVSQLTVLQTVSKGLRSCQAIWLKWKIYNQVNGKTIVCIGNNINILQK